MSCNFLLLHVWFFFAGGGIFISSDVTNLFYFPDFLVIILYVLIFFPLFIFVDLRLFPRFLTSNSTNALFYLYIKSGFFSGFFFFFRLWVGLCPIFRFSLCCRILNFLTCIFIFSLLICQRPHLPLFLAFSSQKLCLLKTTT